VSEPALPGALSAVDRLVVSLVAGINMRALYGSEHPALSSHVDRILEAVGTACEEYRKEAITFLVVGQDLVVENQPLRTGSLPRTARRRPRLQPRRARTNPGRRPMERRCRRRVLRRRLRAEP
jgi:hypothetical protein